MDLRATILARADRDGLAADVAQVRTLARPPDDTLYYDQLKARYRRISRFRPTFVQTISSMRSQPGRPCSMGIAFSSRLRAKPIPPCAPHRWRS